MSAAEPNTESLHGTIPKRDELATRWQDHYIGLLSLWKGEHFLLTGTDTYSGYEVVFLHAVLLTKPQFVDLWSALPAIMVFHIDLFLIKEFTSQ